jgi:hypothetical protein
MAAADDVDEVVEQYHLAQGEFVKGNPEPAKKLFSHREDVSLANPLGPPARGWEQVAQTMERAASNFRDGNRSTLLLLGRWLNKGKKEASISVPPLSETERKRHRGCM